MEGIILEFPFSLCFFLEIDKYYLREIFSLKFRHKEYNSSIFELCRDINE